MNDLKEKENVNIEENLDIDIGIDGSWLKQGHSSLNCIVTGVARENKKILIITCSASFVKAVPCGKVKKGKRIMGKIVKLITSRCSGAMESVGAQSFFQSSVDKSNTSCAHYIGDGDAETF